MGCLRRVLGRGGRRGRGLTRGLGKGGQAQEPIGKSNGEGQAHNRRGICQGKSSHAAPQVCWRTAPADQRRKLKGGAREEGEEIFPAPCLENENSPLPCRL